jgi:hypothetical protein
MLRVTFLLQKLLKTFFLNNQPDALIIKIYSVIRGSDSVVGIATAYGLDSPGIESRWGRDFPHLSGPALKPTQPPVQWIPGISRRKGAAGV